MFVLKVLGIDPGSVICGYGVIEKKKNSLHVIEYGVIKAKKISENFPERLKEIYLRLLKVIERTKPDVASFESTFYSKNAQSLLKLAHARASAMLAAAMNDTPVMEYSPKEVKKSVTGKGSASKEQVQFMVKTLLNIKETPEFFDVTDALAVAICHCLRADLPSSKSGTWEEFIKKNPGRIAKI
ncbi:MAG: crossover junction endodeoxyribonuclease RuvC [Ignavibacteriae bacterium]|nr:crossover junction endodeoxyribonuclease RuvC [Ignavibacteriota bacterium]